MMFNKIKDIPQIAHNLIIGYKIKGRFTRRKKAIMIQILDEAIMPKYKILQYKEIDKIQINIK